jgi:hypothetical protein
MPATITDGSMTFLVSFHPTSSGLKSANVIVSSNAVGSPHIAEVAGESSTSDSYIVVAHRTELFSNYPNPFNPETTIRFSVGAIYASAAKSDGRLEITPTAQVSINIYNIRGHKIRSLVNGEFSVGEHSIVWDGTDDNGQVVGSGIYLYRMLVGAYTETRKMILLK